MEMSDIPRNGVLETYGYESIAKVDAAAKAGFDFTTLDGVGDKTDEYIHEHLGGSMTALRKVLPKKTVHNLAQHIEATSLEEVAEFVMDNDYFWVSKVPRLGPEGAFALVKFFAKA